jgi:hypothetical protein
MGQTRIAHNILAGKPEGGHAVAYLVEALC